LAYVKLCPSRLKCGTNQQNSNTELELRRQLKQRAIGADRPFFYVICDVNPTSSNRPANSSRNNCLSSVFNYTICSKWAPNNYRQTCSMGCMLHSEPFKRQATCGAFDSITSIGPQFLALLQGTFWQQRPHYLGKYALIRKEVPSIGGE
jgi:hypothetical protein